TMPARRSVRRSGERSRMPMKRTKTTRAIRSMPRLLAAAVASLAAACGGGEIAPAPPPTVTVANPVVQSVTSYLDFTGNTAGSDTDTLVVRMHGDLETIHFTDGARVKKGDLLFTIQQDQYEAQLHQAE